LLYLSPKKAASGYYQRLEEANMGEKMDSEGNGNQDVSAMVASRRKAKEVKAAIAGVDLWSCRDEAANTLLHDAVSEGAFPCVMKVIIEAIGDVNVRNIYGETPLGLAAAGGKTKMAKMLLEAGAYADFPDKQHRTALMKAADGGHAGIVAMLIEHGADVNAVDRHQETALMMAAAWGHHKVVQALVRGGAACDVPNKEGWTAMTFAQDLGHTEVVKILEKCSNGTARRAA